MTTDEKLETVGLDPKSFAFLTPDDILTLRLLRDEEQSHAARWPDEKHRRLDDMRILDTLNHILKQVE